MNIIMAWGARSFVFLFAILGAGICAHGANVEWRSGGIYSGAAGYTAIDTRGTLVAAVNAASLSVGNLTVDPFGINITFTPSSLLSGAEFLSTSPGSSDAAWNTIIENTDYNLTNGGTFSLTGLTAGRRYQVQIFASDDRIGSSARSQYFTDGAGNASFTKLNGAYASVIGTFTADGTAQSIQAFQTASNPVINAYVLRDVTDAPAYAMPQTIRPVAVPVATGWNTGAGNSPLELINGHSPPGTVTGFVNNGYTDDRYAIHGTSSGGANFGHAFFEGSGADKELVFDLGGAFDLNSILLWNGLQTSNSNRQIAQMDVQVSSSATLAGAQADFADIASVTATISVPIYNNTISQTHVHSAFEIALEGLGLDLEDVTFVRFSNFVNAANSIFAPTVLAEVRFTGTPIPEPSSATLACMVLGACGLLARRRPFKK